MFVCGKVSGVRCAGELIRSESLLRMSVGPQIRKDLVLTAHLISRSTCCSVCPRSRHADGAAAADV